MKRFAITTMLVFALVMASQASHAGTITYSLVNYPAYQNGATLSGTITTDGVIGYLTASDILSWNWTTTQASGASFTVTSSDPGALAESIGSVVASATDITIPAPAMPEAGIDNRNGFSLFIPHTRSHWADIGYLRITAGFEIYASEYYTGFYWGDSLNPRLGNGYFADPWVVAVALSVPEPSSLMLAAIGATCWIAFGRKRICKTEGVPRSS